MPFFKVAVDFSSMRILQVAIIFFGDGLFSFSLVSVVFDDEVYKRGYSL